jgi:DNA-directed RNA polymerase delta subunit
VREGKNEAEKKIQKMMRWQARWQIRSIYYFDSIKEKSQGTQEILYSEKTKRRRASGITKEVEGQQKNT